MLRRRRRVSEVEEPQPQPGQQYVREEVVEPPPPRPLIWPWLLLLLLLVATGVALAYLLTRDGGSADRVPEVVGLREADAVELLREEGYPADVRRRMWAETQIGRVLNQEPEGGAELDRGRIVVVVVGRGPGTVEIPKVVGLPATEAFERLQAARLRGESRDVFASRPKGTVVRQKPSAGAQARRGSVVVISVSKGPRLVTVPAVQGLTEAQASGQLARAGFQPRVVRVPSSEPVGIVVAQNPQAGKRAQRGSTVRVNVSRGGESKAVTLPDVVGNDEATARGTLEKLGLGVRTVDRPATDPTQDGIVVEQRPPAGTRVPAGSPVTLFIGRLS